MVLDRRHHRQEVLFITEMASHQSNGSDSHFIIFIALQLVGISSTIMVHRIALYYIIHTLIYLGMNIDDTLLLDIDATFLSIDYITHWHIDIIWVYFIWEYLIVTYHDIDISFIWIYYCSHYFLHYWLGCVCGADTYYISHCISWPTFTIYHFIWWCHWLHFAD